MLDFFCNGCQRQQIIIIIGRFIFYQRLSSRTADIILSLILQNILHGIRLVIVSGQSGREAHMGSFDGIISMVNSYNDKSPHPFWFSLFFSSRWSFGLGKEKKGRTPKSSARNKKYSHVYLQINTHNCISLILINLQTLLTRQAVLLKYLLPYCFLTNQLCYNLFRSIQIFHLYTLQL